jgi:hypothetical protein
MTSTGNTHPKITTTTTLQLAIGLSRSSGSYNGHIISVSGNGLPTVADKFLSINLVCKNFSTLIMPTIVTPSRVTFETVPYTGVAD